MQSIITLVLVLTPLFIGFSLPVSTTLAKNSDIAIGYLVYVILALIGFELAQVEGLISQFPSIFSQVVLLAIISIGSGLIGVAIFDIVKPWQKTNATSTEANTVDIWSSLKQVSSVFLGFIAGTFAPATMIPHWLINEHTMTALLMLLILLVGIGLKGSGIKLSQVLLNKRGVQISVIFTLSVWCGGVCYSLFMPDVSVTQALALVSGFGWYSLSGIIMTDAYGAVWGSVALFNDLIREFFALVFIPFIMRYFPSSALAVGGATSLDFTLPVIQQSGGHDIVPMTISFGFIINIIAPIAMVFFSSL